MVTSAVGPAGQIVLFTCGPCIKNVTSLCRTLAKRKDAAALKAHAGGTTASSLSLSTPCPICINSYVTMASVYNSAAAVAHRNRKWHQPKDPVFDCEASAVDKNNTAMASRWSSKQIRLQNTTVVETYQGAEVNKTRYKFSVVMYCTLTSSFV